MECVWYVNTHWTFQLYSLCIFEQILHLQDILWYGRKDVFGAAERGPPASIHGQLWGGIVGGETEGAGEPVGEGSCAAAKRARRTVDGAGGGASPEQVYKRGQAHRPDSILSQGPM